MPGRRAPEPERREQILAAAHAVATRAGIDGVTVRAVAAEAALSHGLVVFYFRRKDLLIAALLDRVLATATVLAVPDAVARLPHAPERLRAVLRRELERRARDPADFRLFLEYWALGTRAPDIRVKIAGALERYRAALRAVAVEVLGADGAAAPAGVTPDGFAAVAVSLIDGCALQAVIAPQSFDLAAYLETVQGIIERLGAPAPQGAASAAGAGSAASAPR